MDRKRRKQHIFHGITGHCSIWAVIFLLAGSVNSAWGQASANASFSPEIVEAGDTFNLRVLVRGAKTAPKGIDFSAWQSQLPHDNMLRESSWQRSGEQWVKRFTFIAFEDGVLSLPSIIVITHLNDSVPTNPLQLRVDATPVKAELSAMETVRDIRRTEGFNWTDLWPLTVALALILAFFWWRMRRKRPALPPVEIVVIPEPATPTPNPYETAMAALQSMTTERPWGKKGAVVFYTNLAATLRSYLEAGHNIPAPETTTRETVALLRKSGFPEQLTKDIQTLLQRSDLVKYAHNEPDNPTHLKSLEAAVHIVEQAQRNNQPPISS